MHFKQYITLSVILGLTACQSGDGPTKADAAQTSADISLRATSAIETPSPIKAASFVPNSVATWLGHIILLDEKGTLHRATTGSARTEVVALGKYVDVIGLARGKKSGVFLALTQQGQIKAFIQSDDEGNFLPMVVDQESFTFERFCGLSEPSGIRFWAKTKSGEDRVFATKIYQETSLFVYEVEPVSIEPSLCDQSQGLKLDDEYIFNQNTNSEYLSLDKDEVNLTVAISNGLSIGGIQSPGFVTVTSNNMGSVFNEGVLLVAEKDKGRLVLVSRSYALKELEAR